MKKAFRSFVELKIDEKIQSFFIKAAIKEKNILVGEVHGIRENLQFLLFFTFYLKKHGNLKSLAIEWPLSIQSYVNAVLQDNTQSAWKKLIERPELLYLNADGRMSIEHLWFLKQIAFYNNKQLRIICFDEPHVRDWNEREEKMYKNFTKNRPDSGPVLILAGNAHTETEIHEIEKVKIKPFGAYFDSFARINIQYLSGDYFNFGKHKFPRKRGKKKKLDNLNEFDFTIERAHAVHPMPFDKEILKSL